MGKSSLMAQTAARLRQQGVAVAVLDLQAVGQNLSPEQWYDGLLATLGKELDLEEELDQFWLEQERLGPLQRWMAALQEVVLARVPGAIVLFIDEIDAVRSLPFSTDEFFAAIRAYYNRRTEEPKLARLTFCLLGVASPSDLIRDTRTTPFNIGRRIELADFTEAEAAVLTEGLTPPPPPASRVPGLPEAERGSHAVLVPLSASERGSRGEGLLLLRRILYWTGGHPYLTQRLCKAVAEAGAARRVVSRPPRPAPSARTKRAWLDRLCEALFLSPRARERDDNLLFVRERLLRSEADLASLLEIYRQVRCGRRVRDDETNPLVSVLRLSGIVRPAGGELKVRNRIYERVFDPGWVQANMPDAELRRQRAAYRRGLWRAALASAGILAAMGALALLAVRQARHAEAQRRIAQQVQQAQRRQLYVAEMNLAQQAIDAANIPRAVELLVRQRPADGQEDLRGWEWRYLWQRTQQDDARLTIEANQWVLAFLTFTPDGRTLVSTGWSGLVRFWDAARGRELAQLEGAGDLTPIAVSPNGRLLAWGGRGNAAKLWDLASGREVSELKGHVAYLRAVAFSPDGKLLATGSWDNTARVWDLATRRSIATLTGYRNGVSSVQFSPDGRLLVTAGNIGAPRLWSRATWREVARLEGMGQIDSALFSPDGQTLVLGDSYTGTVRFWDVGGRQLRATLAAHRAPWFAMAVSPDGRFLATGSSDGTVRLWSMATRELLTTLLGHKNAVTCVAFSPDSKSVVSGSWDGTIRLWPAAPQKDDRVKAHRGAIIGGVLSGDGRTVATGGYDGTVAVYDLASRRKLAGFQAHAKEVERIAISPDGRTVATTTSDGTVKIWDARTGRRIASFASRASWPYVAVEFSRDGQLLAWASDAATMTLWDVRTRREVGTLKEPTTGRTGSAQFSRDGHVFAVGSPPPDAGVRLWDLEARRVIRILGGQQNWAGPLAFSPDGGTLAVGSGDYTVRIWDWTRGRLVTTLKGDTGQINGIAFSPDGRTLAASSGDANSLTLWSTASWGPVLTLRDANFRSLIDFSPDGRSLIGATLDGELQFWRAPTLAETEPQLRRAWHEQSASEAERARDWTAALPHLDAMVAETPKEAPLRVRRAMAFAELGRWDRAAADLAQATALGTANAGAWFDHARAYLALNDLPGYRRACARALDRFAGTGDSQLARDLAWVSALAPGTAPDPAVPVRLAEKQVRVQPESAGALTALGAALYRAGRQEAALRRLEAATRRSPHGGEPEAWLLLALARWCLERREEARQALARAQQAVERILPADARAPAPPVRWQQKLDLQVLRREAGSLIR
jgi:WD40 repeat protein